MASPSDPVPAASPWLRWGRGLVGGGVTVAARLLRLVGWPKAQVVDWMYRGYALLLPGVKAMAVAELAPYLAQHPDALLVDVRSPAEQAISRLPGAISQTEFEAMLGADPQRDPQGNSQRALQSVPHARPPVVVYCTIGYRSGLYAVHLAARGWPVVNLAGSILAWTHAQQPLVDPQGQPTDQVHVYGALWDLAAEGYRTRW